jgi:dihydroorotase
MRNRIAMTGESGLVKAVKLYPAGATTNSQAGVTDLEKCLPVLEEMVFRGMPLLVSQNVYLE